MEIPKELKRKELNETLFTKVFQVASHFSYEICGRSPKLSYIELTLTNKNVVFSELASFTLLARNFAFFYDFCVKLSLYFLHKTVIGKFSNFALG
ncbi:hypothetical protein DPV73_01850 [Leptospira mayottensis]|nr:hypothetical protein DPV73_01850 [Leptospira mayottensis]